MTGRTTNRATAASLVGLLLVGAGLAQGNNAPGIAAAESVAEGNGPVSVVGSWTYSSSLVLDHYVEPTVALLDVSAYAVGDYSDWVPAEGQVLGRLFGSTAEPPVSYVVDLPIRPRGAGVDVDQDGNEDPGVQILALAVASNLTGGSHLFQMDQVSYRSYLADPHSGAIREGAFLIHAPDAEQGFPVAAGDDGLFFTADDPIVTLPAGYTMATLASDGSVAFDRSSEVRMDTIEQVDAETPDFSGQGIAESFASLIDLLAARYAYTELRQLDWNAIRAEYLPRIEAADTAGDMAAYYAALSDLGLSIRDAHVGASTSDPAAKVAFVRASWEPFRGDLGATGLDLSDGRFVVTEVTAGSAAAAAGWVFGTEIVSVDGAPIGDRIGRLPLLVAAGNPEVIHLSQASLALRFPVDATVEVVFKQPGETEIRTSTLTAEARADAPETEAPEVAASGLIETRELEGGFGYVTWSTFREPAYVLAVWEKFLADFHAAPGLVIDLRGNGGGNVELMYTMASYFFSDSDPATWNWLDTFSYDPDAGGLVKLLALDFPLYAPKPELRYDGAIVVLVDAAVASAGEYFPQFLQRHGRAIVIGEHGTEGAGGPVEIARLPGGMAFHYTKGRTYFAGTDELNVEARGVELDVRVAVTLDGEQAKLEGRDPVLEAAIRELESEAGRLALDRLAGTTWQVARIVSAPDGPSNPSLPSTYSVTFGSDGALSVNTDCNTYKAEFSLGENQSLSIAPTISTLAACPPGSPAEDFVGWLSAAESLQFDSSGLFIFTAAESGVIGILFSAVN